MTPTIPMRPAAITLAIGSIFIVVPLLPPVGVGVGAAALLGLTAAAWRRRDRHGFPLGVLGSVSLLGALAAIPFSQVFFALGLVAYWVVVRKVPWVTPRPEWMQRGSFRRDVALLSLGAAALAGASLLVWFLLVQPDVDDILARFFPDVSMALLLPGALVFSAINAAVEEGVYRGALMDSLAGVVGTPSAVALQAVAFGTLHIQGFPRGWTGIGLAVVFGLMMGVIRVRARGIIAPWLAHVATDMSIAGILILLAL